jgi:hypothetical protein
MSALRSLHKHQQVRTTTVSKALRLATVSCLRDQSHQSGHVESGEGVTCCGWSAESNQNQVSLLKTQDIRRWATDSDAWPHRAHGPLLGSPWRSISRSDVQHRPSRDEKIAGRRRLSFCTKCLPPVYCTDWPWEKARYADAEEKHWSDVHFQRNLSGCWAWESLIQIRCELRDCFTI